MKGSREAGPTTTANNMRRTKNKMERELKWICKVEGI